MWKGAENWDGKNVNEYGWLLVMDKGSWSKQNLGLGTAHRISNSNTEDEISTETGANFLFLYKRSSKSMRKAVYIHAEKIRIPKKQININVHR